MYKIAIRKTKLKQVYQIATQIKIFIFFGNFLFTIYYLYCIIHVYIYKMGYVWKECDQ